MRIQLSWDEHPYWQTIGATIAEELGFGLLNWGMSAAKVKEKVKRLATEIGLQDQLLQSPATLSGGERQRLVIAAVLALQPSFNILDESLFHARSGEWTRIDQRGVEFLTLWPFILWGSGKVISYLWY